MNNWADISEQSYLKIELTTPFKHALETFND